MELESFAVQLADVRDACLQFERAETPDADARLQATVCSLVTMMRSAGHSAEAIIVAIKSVTADNGGPVRRAAATEVAVRHCVAAYYGTS